MACRRVRRDRHEIARTYSRSGVELRNLVLVNKLPVSRRVRVHRSRFEERGRRTQSQGTVDDVPEANESVQHSVVDDRLTYDP